MYLCRVYYVKEHFYFFSGYGEGKTKLCSTNTVNVERNIQWTFDYFWKENKKIGIVNQWVSLLFERLKFTSVWTQTSIVPFNSVRQRVGPHMRNWSYLYPVSAPFLFRRYDQLNFLCCVNIFVSRSIFVPFSRLLLLCLSFFLMKQPPGPALPPCGPANTWKKG